MLANTRQVHTALGMTEDTLNVQWASDVSSAQSELMWGLSSSALTNHAVGDVMNFTQDNGRTWQTRTATMTGLTVGTKYYYKVGDSLSGFSAVFDVTNRQVAMPYRHMLFGDMGNTHAYTICSACTASTTCNATTCAQNTTVGLVSEVETSGMFLHAGDFAYDLDSNYGKTGDEFMNNIEQLAARVPYMISHGNHEDSKGAFAHYAARFRSQPVNSVPAMMTSPAGTVPNTLYFSWDYGMVHYISISTELWHSITGKDGNITKDACVKWIEADLIKANLPENRAKYPWILVHGHRPLYSSSGSDTSIRSSLETMFHKYGVSFSVNGHQHNYERSWPTLDNKSEKSYENPNATIYIVTGAAGSHEMHTPFSKDQPDWSAFRSNTFGYTRMIVYNSSHINFQQIRTDPTLFPLSGYGDIIDDYWVVQGHQGGFNPLFAPKETGIGGTSYDHFDPTFRPMLGETDKSIPLYKVIQAYKAKHGLVAYVQKLDELLAFLNKNAQSTGEWEDGNLDAKEQAAAQWIHGGQQ